MAAFLKPDNLNIVWASGGDRLYPGDTKYVSGWGVEIPPRQYFNEIDYKQDQMIAHINQHGVVVWDSVTEYQAGKSYVQGSDGVVYQALTTHSSINPVGDVSGTWIKAFLATGDATQVATATQSRAMTANDVFLSPLQLSNAFTGSKQNQASSGFQYLPGGLLLQWYSGALVNSKASFPIPFPNNVFVVVPSDNLSNNNVSWDSSLTTLSQAHIIANTTTETLVFIAIGN